MQHKVVSGTQRFYSAPTRSFEYISCLTHSAPAFLLLTAGPWVSFHHQASCPAASCCSAIPINCIWA